MIHKLNTFKIIFDNILNNTINQKTFGRLPPAPECSDGYQKLRITSNADSISHNNNINESIATGNIINELANLYKKFNETYVANIVNINNMSNSILSQGKLPETCKYGLNKFIQMSELNYTIDIYIMNLKNTIYSEAVFNKGKNLLSSLINRGSPSAPNIETS